VIGFVTLPIIDVRLQLNAQNLYTIQHWCG